jgi:hypothetical protein
MILEQALLETLKLVLGMLTMLFIIYISGHKIIKVEHNKKGELKE